jgi:hypothetical protein
LTDVSELIALMKEAVSTSETLVNFYESTRLNIPEDSHLQEASGLEWSSVMDRENGDL